MKPRLDNRLYYFTVEDESVLGETFPRFGEDTYAIAYKVVETDDVFVTTAETKDAMERHDVPYNGLAEEDGIRVSVFHNELSREELSDYEDALRALALAHRAIALLCVGINGEPHDFSDGILRYTYFNAPAGHVFVCTSSPTATKPRLSSKSACPATKPPQNGHAACRSSRMRSS